MADEQQTAETPKAEVKAPPITEEQALAELADLLKRIEAANLSPMLLMARVGWRRGAGFFDGLLAKVEEGLSADRGKKA